MATKRKLNKSLMKFLYEKINQNTQSNKPINKENKKIKVKNQKFLKVKKIIDNDIIAKKNQNGLKKK
jgi:hypothetical protein